MHTHIGVDLYLLEEWAIVELVSRGMRSPARLPGWPSTAVWFAGIVCQPSHIPRNLDLMFCPAIIWYQTGYSTFTLRQASRRSWRIGQTKPVTVRFLCYENTAQVGCLRLMGRKLLVSMAIEGKFSDSGLQSMDDGSDVLTTLARELVMHQGVGQSADEVWKLLRSRNSFHYSETGTIPSEPQVSVDLSCERLYRPAIQLSLFG